MTIDENLTGSKHFYIKFIKYHTLITYKNNICLEYIDDYIDNGKQRKGVCTSSQTSVSIYNNLKTIRATCM